MTRTRPSSSAYTCTPSIPRSNTHCACGRNPSLCPRGECSAATVLPAPMSLVTASIQIAAPPAKVWKFVMDPDRLADWVTVHRVLRHADDGPPRVGYRMDQQLHLRGVSLEIHWKLVECRPDEL